MGAGGAPWLPKVIGYGGTGSVLHYSGFGICVKGKTFAYSYE